jgi:glycosyltransferase involved in cell wall biosynthesis
MDLWIARREGGRTVLHVHGAAFDRFFERAGPLGQQVVRSGLARADVVVALSPWWRDRLQTMSPRTRIKVVENAVDLPERPAGAAGGGEPFRFVLLARMDVWKGIDDALDAIGLLQDRGQRARLVLAGPEGTAGDAQALRAKIASRGVERFASYLGCVEGAAKQRLLAESDCLIQPSHHEGMPLSVLEALAHGLPVIATRVGSVPEVIEDGVQGLLVPPHRPDLLAAVMARLVDDRRECGRMSVAARALAEQRFSLKRFQRDLTCVYDGLTGTRTSGGGLRLSIMFSRAAAVERAPPEPTAEPAGAPAPAVL